MKKTQLTLREKNRIVKNALMLEANRITVSIHALQVRIKRERLELAHLRLVLKDGTAKVKK
jgi:hypothetical protein